MSKIQQRNSFLFPDMLNLYHCWVTFLQKHKQVSMCHKHSAKLGKGNDSRED